MERHQRWRRLHRAALILPRGQTGSDPLVAPPRDTDFGAGGVLDLDLEEGPRINAVAFQSDGRLVAAGTIDANGSQTGGFLLAGVADGALDASCDANGLESHL